MNNLICTNITRINIQVKVIDQAIVDLQKVVDNLEGEEGLKKIVEIEKLMFDNLSGEFKESIIKSLGKRMVSYEEAVSNIINMIYVLKIYREYLKNGPNTKINENLEHIEIEPVDMNKEIIDFEMATNDVKLKMNQNSEEDSYAINHRKYLEDEIRRKLNHKPHPLDASYEKHLLSVLTHNDSEHKSIRPTINNRLNTIIQLNSTINEKIGVLKNEVDSYYKLWDIYENTDLKIIEYSESTYSLDDISKTFKTNSVTLEKLFLLEKEKIDTLVEKLLLAGEDTIDSLLQVEESTINTLLENLFSFDRKTALSPRSISFLESWIEYEKEILGGVEDIYVDILSELTNMSAKEKKQISISTVLNNLEDVYESILKHPIKTLVYLGITFFEYFTKNTINKNSFLEFFDLETTNILQAIDSVGLADAGFAIYHLHQLINRDTSSYEGLKQLSGDFGSSLYGFTGGVIGELTGSKTLELLFSAGGSVLGEIGGEAIFEVVVPEDPDHTVHWFTEEEWWNYNT